MNQAVQTETVLWLNRISTVSCTASTLELRDYNYCLAIAKYPERPQRLRFKFYKPLSLGAYTAFSFTLSAICDIALSCNLVDGDSGFPDIRIHSKEGFIYRFKRGNLKDFFKLSQRKSAQRLVIPLRFFQYDVQYQSNKPNPIALQNCHISIIEFEFQQHYFRDLQLEIGKVCLTAESEQDTQQSSSCLLLSEVANHSPISPFYTETGRMSLRVACDEPGLFDPHCETQFQVDVLDYWGTRVLAHNQPGEIQSSGALLPLTVKIVLPKPGYYTVLIKAFQGDSLLGQRGQHPIAETAHSLGFGLPSGQCVSSFLGISDAAFAWRVNATGGRYQRRFISLSHIEKYESGDLYWRKNRLPFPPENAYTNQDFIICIKSMPNWLSSRCGNADSFRYGPSDWQEFERVVGFAVQLAVDCGYHIFECWNEASAKAEWNDSVETLVKMHQHFYRVVKSIDPDAIVLGCTTNTFHLRFIEEFLALGGAAYCDAIAIHGYTYQPESICSEMHALVSLLHQYEGRNGNPANLSQFKLYVTEVGFRYPAFSLQEQMCYLLHFTLLASSIPNFEAVLWFRLQNTYREDLSFYDQNASTGYAMIGFEQMSLRPSYLAYKVLCRFLEYYSKSVAEPLENKQIFRFEHHQSNGKPAYVVYQEKPDGSETFWLPDGYLAYNVFGAIFDRQLREVPLSMEPIYIVPMEMGVPCFHHELDRFEPPCQGQAAVDETGLYLNFGDCPFLYLTMKGEPITQATLDRYGKRELLRATRAGGDYCLLMCDRLQNKTIAWHFDREGAFDRGEVLEND